MLKLTKETLEQREKGIQRSLLPRTLRDAIKICKWLNINYLWIDALCIVQDDLVEWNEEAPRMAEVYEGAYITIAATSAADCNDGCISPREASKEILGVHDCGKPFSVFVRPRLGHAALFFSNNDSEYPVFQRGWCFQERILSRRVLHFTKKELIFECSEGLRCDCSRVLQHGYGSRTKALYTRMIQKDSTAEFEDSEVSF